MNDRDSMFIGITPALSVVIIGRNEGARLTRCIESVKAMRFPSENVRQAASLPDN